MSEIHPIFKTPKDEDIVAAFDRGMRDAAPGRQFNYRLSGKIRLGVLSGFPPRTVQLYVALITPLEWARQRGYGLAKATRPTAADHADQLNLVRRGIGRWTKAPNFYVAWETTPDGEAEPWFALTPAGGERLEPKSVPEDVGTKDFRANLINSVVTFPAFEKETPYITAETKTVTFEAGVSESAGEVQFTLG